MLRPGGLLISTVNKDAAVLAGRVRGRAELPQADDLDRVADAGARHGLVPDTGTTFAGLGQGTTSLAWRERLASEYVPWVKRAGAGRLAELNEQLAALPDQDRARPDPVYRLVAFRRG